jgi:hypothetical protein
VEKFSFLTPLWWWGNNLYTYKGGEKEVGKLWQMWHLHAHPWRLYKRIE